MFNNRTDKMTQNFGRALLTSIYDTLENGLSRIPIATDKEYYKYLKTNFKGACELVG